MNLSQQIKEDIKTAMKGKDTQTLDVLRMLAASMKNKAIDLKKELEDAEVLQVIKSDVKKLEDALEEFVKAAREDLAQKLREEIAILRRYLPAEMPDEELLKRVTEVLKKEGVKDVSQMGAAMGAAMAELKGLADGKRVKAAVEKILKG